MNTHRLFMNLLNAKRVPEMLPVVPCPKTSIGFLRIFTGGDDAVCLSVFLQQNDAAMFQFER